MNDRSPLVSVQEPKFYPITPQHPPISVRVVVHWYGRELKAMRVVSETRLRHGDRRTRDVYWVTFERGQLVELPPRGQEERWGPEPDGWRPEHPDKWKAPLPPPLFGLTRAGARSGRGGAVAPGRLAPMPPAAAGSGKYAAMSAQAAESDRRRAEILAEVEAEHGTHLEPEVAVGSETRLRQDGVAGECASAQQWWLHKPLTYSEPGDISIEEAEGRVARAILVDGIRSRYGGPRPYAMTSSALNGHQHERVQSEDADDVTALFEPTRRDNSDYETAFGWFNALNPPELWHGRREAWSLSQAQFVLVARVLIPQRSWRQIADLTKTSHEGARRVYGGAIAGVHRAANGKPVLPYMTVEDRMAALRERNRRAKMEA